MACANYAFGKNRYTTSVIHFITLLLPSPWADSRRGIWSGEQADKRLQCFQSGLRSARLLNMHMETS